MGQGCRVRDPKHDKRLSVFPTVIRSAPMTTGTLYRIRTFGCALSLAPLLSAASSVASVSAAPAPVKGTEILWDRYGIPHITAADHPSLFYAYGYAQMEAHSELLLRLYAQSRGRGAELYGESYLEADRWVRVNGIPETAKAWASQQSLEFAPLLRAFVDGLNGWTDEHKD